MVRKKRSAKLQTIAVQEIRELRQKVETLQQRVQQLSVEQECLSVQQHILARICDLLHCLRTGDVHQGWANCWVDDWTDQWLLEELPLLRDLGVPYNSSLAAQLSQLQLTNQQEQQQESNQMLSLQPLQQPQQPLQHASSSNGHDEVSMTGEAESGPASASAAAAAGAALVHGAASANAGHQCQWQLKQQVAREVLLQEDGFAALEAQLTWDLQQRQPQQQHQETTGQAASRRQLQARSTSTASAGHAAASAALGPADAAAAPPNTVSAGKQRDSPLPKGNGKSPTTAGAVGGGDVGSDRSAGGVSCADVGSDGGGGGFGPATLPWGAPPPLPPPTAPHMYMAAPGDYLGCLLYVFSQPPYPGAADMTLQQFAEHYASFARNVALHLALAEQQMPQFECTAVAAELPHIQQQPVPVPGQVPTEGGAGGQGCPPSSSQDTLQQQRPPLMQDQPPPAPQQQQQQHPQQGCGAGHPLHALRAFFLEHARLIISLMMLHQGDLLPRVRACNLSTLEVEDGGNQAWQRTCWLVDRLQLRSDQQAAIVSGNSLFKQLIAQLLAARQELQQHQQQQAALRLPTGRAVDLAEQDQLAQRLQVLVKKELFLVTCASAFVSGVLDVVQLGKCVVLAWPFITQMMMLGPVVVEKVQQQQEQEQQRRQQEQHKQ